MPTGTCSKVRPLSAKADVMFCAVVTGAARAVPIDERERCLVGLWPLRFTVWAPAPEARLGFAFLSIGTSPFDAAGLPAISCRARLPAVHYDIARLGNALNSARFLQLALHLDMAPRGYA